MSHWEELERPAPRRGRRRRRRGAPAQPRAPAAEAGRGRLRHRARRARPRSSRRSCRTWTGAVQLAVTVEDDPGRDLGEDRQIGHRFFFSPEEVEPLGTRSPRGRGDRASWSRASATCSSATTASGSRSPAGWPRSALPAGVDVADFGIRGMDLAYALRDYDAAILVDALPRGSAPGTLYLIEPELDDARARRPTRTAWTRSRCWRWPAISAARCRACWCVGLRAGARP